MVDKAQLAAAKLHTIFLKHHPVLAFGRGATGAPKPGAAGLQPLQQAAYPESLFHRGTDWIVNSQIHLFQALDFASGQPAEWLTGNAGSPMKGKVDKGAALQGQPAPGAGVQTAHRDVFQPFPHIALHAGLTGKNGMDLMLADVGGVAGFGYKFKLMQKYQELAPRRCCRLIVAASDDEATQPVADRAKRHVAILAEKYN